jgi:hypothetical protein
MFGMTLLAAAAIAAGGGNTGPIVPVARTALGTGYTEQVYSGATRATSAFNVTVGQLIVVCVGFTDTRTGQSVTDLAGNTYHRALRVVDSNNGAVANEVWYCLAANGDYANNVATFTADGNMFSVYAVAMAYDGGGWAYEGAPPSQDIAAPYQAGTLTSAAFSTGGRGVVVIVGGNSYYSDLAATSFGADTYVAGGPSTLMRVGERINAAAQSGTTVSMTLGDGTDYGRPMLTAVCFKAA